MLKRKVSMKKWKEGFGQNLRKKRREMDLTQKELAKKIGVSKGCVSLYENGLCAPSYDKILKIANYLQITIDSLCFLDRIEGEGYGQDNSIPAN